MDMTAVGSAYTDMAESLKAFAARLDLQAWPAIPEEQSMTD